MKDTKYIQILITARDIVQSTLSLPKTNKENANAYFHCLHYNDVIVSVMVSQITSVSIVYVRVCSGANQRKHQRSASPAFVRGIYRLPVNSPHKGTLTRKMFPFDDVIMWHDSKLKRVWLNTVLVALFVFVDLWFFMEIYIYSKPSDQHIFNIHNFPLYFVFIICLFIEQCIHDEPSLPAKVIYLS